jgi:hypothetical protein
MSPLLSPPAGMHTDKTLSDKFVCTARIPRIVGKFNGDRDFSRWAILGNGDRISTGFPFTWDLPSPVAQIDGDTMLPAARIESLEPDARVFGRWSLNRQIKSGSPSAGQAIFFVEFAAQRSARKPALSTEQSPIDRPAITPVSKRHVTSARSVAAKVVSTVVICFARRAAWRDNR